MDISFPVIMPILAYLRKKFNSIIISIRDKKKNTDDIILQWDSEKIYNNINTIESYKDKEPGFIITYTTRDDLAKSLDILNFFISIKNSIERERIVLDDIKKITDKIKDLLKILSDKKELFNELQNKKIKDLSDYFNTLK